MENNSIPNSVQVKPSPVKKKLDVPRRLIEKDLKKRSTNPKKIKIVKFLLVITLCVTVGFFSVIRYKRNFSSEAVLNTSITNLKKDKEIKYDGVVKITFSYTDREEKININEMEIYSLLKRSVSDNHEIKVSGEHNKEFNTPFGKYRLIWSVSDRNIFSLDGYYKGYDLFYKIYPYEYSDVFNAELKEKYSQINISELLNRILLNKDGSNITDDVIGDIEAEIIEVLQSDIINGSKAYHYKVKISNFSKIKKILPGINISNIDIWIENKSLLIKKIRAEFSVNDIGSVGNNMNVLSVINFLD